MKGKTWDEVSGRAGRNDMPYLLGMAVFSEKTLTDLDEIAKGIHDAWTMAEWPEDAMEPEVWMALFELVGYLDEDVRKTGISFPDVAREAIANGWQPDAPLNTIVVYRGAVESRKAAMSWTGDLEQARWFAHRFDGIHGGKDHGKVWRLEVSEPWILAHFHEGRHEDEYVLAMDDYLAEEIEQVVEEEVKEMKEERKVQWYAEPPRRMNAGDALLCAHCGLPLTITIDGGLAVYLHTATQSAACAAEEVTE